MANDPKKSTTKESNKDSKERKDDLKKKTATIDLGFLEEDDDFEEFPAENYDLLENDDIEPVNIWEDDWDDDNIEDDFSAQLK
ncbi:26S proteasome complex subunit [Dermatophagoides farinae]|nr:26S proteasome complex subunit [Dermatophagoides farinae]